MKTVHFFLWVMSTHLYCLDKEVKFSKTQVSLTRNFCLENDRGNKRKERKKTWSRNKSAEAIIELDCGGERVWSGEKMCKMSKLLKVQDNKFPRLIEPVKYTFRLHQMKVNICNYLQMVALFAFLSQRCKLCLYLTAVVEVNQWHERFSMFMIPFVACQDQ